MTGWKPTNRDQLIDSARQLSRMTRCFQTGFGVTMTIVLTSKTHANEICEEVAESLNRNGEVNASHISVTGDHNAVCLRGTVHTWAERREARWLGIRQV